MKIICLQEKLKNAINLVEKIAGKNINLPILNNLLLETDKGRLKISATDLEIAIVFWLTAKIEKTGKVTVPASILNNFISSLPREKIYLESEKQNLKIKCNNFQAQIKGLDPNDFPIIPHIKGEELLKLKTGVLKKALTQVYAAASFTDTRPEIAGVFLKISRDGIIRFVATDSFRLAEKVLKNPISVNKDISFIIPRKAILELVRTLEINNKDVSIVLQDNQLLFDIDKEIYLISRLIEGHFPDYERIIPTEFATEVLLEKKKVIEAVKLASLFAGKTNDVKLHFTPSGKVEISSHSQELGAINQLFKQKFRVTK